MQPIEHGRDQCIQIGAPLHELVDVAARAELLAPGRQQDGAHVGLRRLGDRASESL
ncbi:hypothetical protein D3C79_1075300 [compost metagenome]